MPYVEQEVRKGLKPYTGQFNADTPGELNFQLTSLVNYYVKNRGGLSYQVINDIVGALEGCKLEFYRRVAVPYENTKIEQNGDVF